MRRTLERCIHLGRQHRSQGRKEDEYEAYRLLGQAVMAFPLNCVPIDIHPLFQLHTLEDFPAHSNFCELSLVSMGHQDIFVHVGDQARIQAPGGKRVAPIVTGMLLSSSHRTRPHFPAKEPSEVVTSYIRYWARPPITLFVHFYFFPYKVEWLIRYASPKRPFLT